MELMKIFQDNTALPKLAEELFWQYLNLEILIKLDKNYFIILNLDLRENAPINDTAAESQVGCINYELKVLTVRFHRMAKLKSINLAEQSELRS